MYVSLYWMVSKSNKLEYRLLLLIFVLCSLHMPVVMDRVNVHNEDQVTPQIPFQDE